MAMLMALFIAACGGDGKNGGDNNNRNNQTVINISIAPLSLNVRVGETKPLTVTRQNTDDFTLSVSPASGSGCEKNGNNAISCTPKAAGTYTVTVTATTDATKKSTATVTVPGLEVLGGMEQTLYADETKGAEIVFNSPDPWTETACLNATRK